MEGDAVFGWYRCPKNPNRNESGVGMKIYCRAENGNTVFCWIGSSRELRRKFVACWEDARRVPGGGRVISTVRVWPFHSVSERLDEKAGKGYQVEGKWFVTRGKGRKRSLYDICLRYLCAISVCDLCRSFSGEGGLESKGLANWQSLVNCL